ncbi:peptidoglycan D,D-transpeptidase FtsI family protein [Salimicrobium flavidum]|uniref:serine-type D-Ala-D-Ala carboxypeptidase n=1 Tax=Salimicrobium flavidum TaxID=570947 RepID=A0A1N7J918_9BACI|nr:penicillin-binding protein 2 [Salimicrobium flavidum]SIS45822.1 cell elongation-specific peptidoglycan D,D-transpeptidase [Salimicrobium flavidum]
MSKKGKSHLSFRLNIIFLIVFLLFAVLILQLGVVQILSGESAQDQIDRTENVTTNIPVPRGEMYDRNGNVIVDNASMYSITYTPPKGVQADDKLALAEKLSQYMSLDTESLRLRDRKEYFFLKNPDVIEERVDEEAMADLDSGEVYQAQLDAITEEEVADYDEETLQVIAINKELNQAYALAPHVVKDENISEEEYSRIAEHLPSLPGINVTTNWERKYPHGTVFQNYLGNISTREQGVPREKLQEYLALDYSRNDRVGRSGLEEEYESVLRGVKEKVQHTTDRNNNVIDSKVIREGKSGKDLVLSIDMEYQKRVDNIVQEELAKAVPNNPHMENAVVVVSKPDTGEVLAVSGQTYNRSASNSEERFSDTSHQAVYNAYLPGSVVKGATVLTGLHEDVIAPGTTFYDRPLQFPASEDMGSYANLGSVNDLQAIQLSSNVYMYNIAMRLGDYYYQPNQPLRMDEEQANYLMRYNFHQFGLGVPTGIDFPFEATGFEGSNPTGSDVMRTAIGQYSSYTAMQLNQYVSTIANGGNRIQPRFVTSIHEPSNSEERLGDVYRDFAPNTQNSLQMDQAYIERVQRGFEMVTQTPQGTSSDVFNNSRFGEYDIAGKSGTAEADQYLPRASGNGTYRVPLTNKNFVGYAPSEDPEIAFSVIVPALDAGASETPNYQIGARVVEAYFQLKEERAENAEEASQNENEES